MNLLKRRTLSLLAKAAAASPFAAWAFVQSLSAEQTPSQSAAGLAPYSGSSPDNCCVYQPPQIEGQNVNGIRVFIFAGLKTHPPGQHDYPQFLADWSKFLTLHGAVVDGALIESGHGPTAAQLAHTDVVLNYKGDAGFMTPQDNEARLAYIKRGGGWVNVHDSLCGPNPPEMASMVGGGKKHGQVNFTLGAPLTYDVVDPASPIMKGMPNGFGIYDEAFYRMTWAANPKIHVLATVKMPDTPAAKRGGGAGKVVPQIWTYEHTVPGGQPSRAFVYMQGHYYVNFSNPVIQNMLLRGIAWAAKHPVDELVNYKQPAGRRAFAPIPMRNQ